MTAIQTLCEIIAQHGPASKETFQDQVGFDHLSRLGLVRSGGVVQSVCCDACEEPHDAPVVYEGGQYGHYCNNAGFVTLADRQLETLEPDIATLVAHLADAFGCKRRKTSPVHNATWRVGAVETHAGDLVIYWQPALQDQNDVRNLKAALSQEIRSQFKLVLTAQGTLVQASAKTALLEDIIDLVSDGNGFTVLADPSEIVGVPRKATGGQHSPYAGNLDALIKERKSDGSALSGRNEEARALKELYQAKHPDQKQPSIPTINRHLTIFRTGS